MYTTCIWSILGSSYWVIMIFLRTHFLDFCSLSLLVRLYHSNEWCGGKKWNDPFLGRQVRSFFKKCSVKKRAVLPFFARWWNLKISEINETLHCPETLSRSLHTTNSVTKTAPLGMSKIAIGWGDHCQYYINVPPANAWPKTWKKFQKLKSLSTVDSIQICLVCICL